jgi:hypothetical protein
VTDPSVVEGSLEVKLPTIWTDGKAEVGRVRAEKSRRKKIGKEKESKTEDAGVEKFPMTCGSGGSKIRLAKAAVRSHVVR